MNKVITINLNGRAYQLEEAGYESLRNYLDQAGAKLADNPDKDEIMADFEQAIADKCDARLSPQKNVITTTEIEDIIKAMGPVDAGSGASATGAARVNAADGNANVDTAGVAGGSANANGGPKRLYRIPRGEWLAGVCMGLSAYFNIDVTVIRVLFVLLTLFTHGFWALAYILFWIVMPVARTDDELAAARGTKPFNAHDFIEQAKARYAEFQKEFPHHPPAPEAPGPDADRDAWRKWKDEMKQWKHEWKADMHRERARRREEMRTYRHGWQNHPWKNQSWQNRPWRDDQATRSGMGFFRFLMGLILAALFLLWAYALWTIFKYGTIFGFAVVASHPLWMSIVFVCALFYALAIPFRMLMRGARPEEWQHYSAFNDVVESLFFILALYLLVYLGRDLFPSVNVAYQMVVTWVRGLRW